MTLFIRLGLAVLFLNELIVGGWNLFWPQSFYAYFPTVDLTPPFSDHYARDFGGATLGIGVVLGIALITPKTHYVVPATLAYSAYSIPHFFYHLHHLHGASVGEAIALTIANATVALLGVVVAGAAISRDDRRRRPRSARPSAPTEHLRR